ncbi:hypothetical protein IG631_09267 [Alternaria alternata]|nr:hypothetical protein IG631_09267 [Alternaria alternata]
MNPCLTLTAARHEARHLDPSRANDYAYFLEPANSHDSVDVIADSGRRTSGDLEVGRSPKAVEGWGRRAPHWRKDVCILSGSTLRSVNEKKRKRHPMMAVPGSYS